MIFKLNPDKCSSGSVACNGSLADKAFLTVLAFLPVCRGNVHYYDDVNNQFSGTLSSE